MDSALRWHRSGDHFSLLDGKLPDSCNNAMRTCFVWITFFVSVASVYGSEALALQERLLEVYEQNKGAIVRVKAAYAGDEVDGKQQVMLRVLRGFY